MKKTTLLLVITALLLISTPSWALNSPTIGADHGVITGLITSDTGLSIGGEYGITSELAVMGEVGGPINRLGGKYQLNSTLALLIGITEESPFLGINGGRKLNSDLTGLYELNISSGGDELSLLYKLGGKFNIDHNLDLRAGLVGFLEDETFPDFQLGIGYKF